MWQEVGIKVLVGIACAVTGGIIVWIFGKSGIISKLIDKIFKRYKKKKDDAKKAAEDDLLKRFGEVVDTKLTPLIKDVEELKEHQKLNTESLVVMTRCHLKDDMDKYVDKGFATDSEKASWKEGVAIYRKNGGNHFREYVNQWEDTVMSLPNKKNSKRRVIKKNVVLNEGNK